MLRYLLIGRCQQLTLYRVGKVYLIRLITCKVSYTVKYIILIEYVASVKKVNAHNTIKNILVMFNVLFIAVNQVYNVLM